MPVFICSVVSRASEGCLLPSSMVSYAPAVFLRHLADMASITGYKLYVACCWRQIQHPNVGVIDRSINNGQLLLHLSDAHLAVHFKHQITLKTAPVLHDFDERILVNLLVQPATACHDM